MKLADQGKQNKIELHSVILNEKIKKRKIIQALQPQMKLRETARNKKEQRFNIS